MIAVVLWTLGGIVAWLVVGIPVAITIGRAIRQADANQPDFLADQPIEVLARAEIRRRMAPFERDLAA